MTPLYLVVPQQIAAAAVVHMAAVAAAATRPRHRCQPRRKLAETSPKNSHVRKRLDNSHMAPSPAVYGVHKMQNEKNPNQLE